MQHIKRIVALLSCFAFFGMLMSCSYNDQFIIYIEEDATFPCVGATRIVLTLIASEPDQTSFVRDIESTGSADDLMWDKTTGKCNVPGKIFQDAPYGGMRTIRVQLMDSRDNTDILIAKGQTVPFSVEAFGEVDTRLVLKLTRKPTVPLGTLYFKLASTPPRTHSIHVFVKPYTDLDGKKHKATTYVIPLETKSAPPSRYSITGLPKASGSERSAIFYAYDKGGGQSARPNRIAKSDPTPIPILFGNIPYKKEHLATLEITLHPISTP